MKCGGSVCHGDCVTRANVPGEPLFQLVRPGSHAEPARAVRLHHCSDVVLGDEHVRERDAPLRHADSLARPSASTARSWSLGVPMSNHVPVNGYVVTGSPCSSNRCTTSGKSKCPEGTRASARGS